MNTVKQDAKVNAEKSKTENRPQSETTTTNAQRLLREQRDLTRITTYGRRDE